VPAALHIGALSARTGRSVHAIRWYEKQGLIPGVVRDAGGRRVYVEQHVEWLALLDRLRATGMSVVEMRRYAVMVIEGRTTLKDRRELLSKHRSRVLETMTEWKLALELIEAKIDFYATWLASGERPREIPKARPKAPRMAAPSPAASAKRAKGLRSKPAT
jgi:DNA-binding transcriptional MerR regulator